MAVTLPYIGLEEVTKDKTGLVKAAVAEFLGTMFLVNMVEKMTCPSQYQGLKVYPKVRNHREGPC